MKKVEYIRCPRCELNYIDKREKLCKVCQSELKAKGTQTLSDEEALEMGLCPVCKTNYITEDENICTECAKERDLQNDRIESFDDMDDQNVGEENWRKYVENDDMETEDDEFGDMSSISEAEDLDDDMAGDLGAGFDDMKDEDFDDQDDEFEFDEDFEDDDDFEDDYDDEDDYDIDDEEEEKPKRRKK